MISTKFSMIIITLVILDSSGALAQPSELSIGIKGGPNAATEAEDLRVNRYGASGGIFGGLQWPLADQFWMGGQAELLYTPRGAETIENGMSLGKVREHYIDLAVVARPEVYFGRASVYLLLGGSVDLLVSANNDNGAGTVRDVTGDLHRIDVALLGAAGVAWHLSGRDPGSFHLGTVFLEARHDIGLLDVDLTGGGKNRTSSLMLGLSFGVGGSSTPAASSTSQTASRPSGRSTSAR